MAALPLAGVTVVEFVHMVMGPSCGLVLADLGAGVIKVEPAPKGDNTRHLTDATGSRKQQLRRWSLPNRAAAHA
jgi:crotonobetainyl-CoA:carnitine CoA-transferase CaiB-like acyl-CoA transferase